MSEIVRQMDVDFEREAACVLQSPYFKTPAPDTREATAAGLRLAEQQRFLSKSLAAARDYSSLQGHAREIYDRAKAAIGGGG